MYNGVKTRLMYNGVKTRLMYNGVQIFVNIVSMGQINSCRLCHATSEFSVTN